MKQWVLLLAAVLSELIGSLCLKAALEHPSLYAVVVVGYVTSFALLGALLRAGLGLGVAYGMWGALGVTLTAVTSSVLFDETLNGQICLGLAVIIIGVFLVQVGSHVGDHGVSDPPAETVGDTTTPGTV